MRVLPLLLIALFAARFSAQGQNVIINGDFEAPVGPGPTPSPVPDWVVSGNVVIDDSEGATSSTHSAVFGANSNSQGNMLSQEFETTSGVTYTLEFDAAVFGKPDSPLQLQVQVTGNMSLLGPTIISPPVSGSFMAMDTVFQHYTFTFMADSTSATLLFADVGTGNAAADVVLDTVSVVSMVPEPSAIALTIFGAGPLLGLLWLKQKSRA